MGGGRSSSAVLPSGSGGPAAAATIPYSAAPASAPAQAARSSGAELLFVQRAARAQLALDSASPTASGLLTLFDADPAHHLVSAAGCRIAGLCCCALLHASALLALPVLVSAICPRPAADLLFPCITAPRGGGLAEDSLNGLLCSSSH